MPAMEEETPREKFLSSQEILSTIEWSDVLQDHKAATEAFGLFDTHMTVILQELMNIKSQKLSRFLKEAVLTIARPIKAIHRIREYIIAEPNSDIAQNVQKDQSVFEAFEERISCMVKDLVLKVSNAWGDRQLFQLRLKPDLENEVNNQHYLLVYLILLLLDKWVAPKEMEASSTYFEYTNPKYRKFSPRGPNAASEPKKDTRATLGHLKSMMEACVKCHLSIEDLLIWTPTPVFSTGADENDDSYDEEALIEDNYPLSETGITTLVSGMIYAMINPTQLPSSYTLPLTLAQDWLFNTTGGLASGYLTNDDSQLAMADKGLLVLLYAIDRTPLNEFKMEALDYCTLDNSADRMGLYQIFQVMVSFAATCSSSSHRFFCFQALDRLVQACEDDVKMYLLEQLVSPKCPYESMRAAAVNLIKATVERAFLSLDRVRKENEEKIRTAGDNASGLTQVKSPFTSPLLLKAFMPSIWRFDVKASEQNPLKSENAWLEKYDMIMHALNFYLFLLIRDPREDNLTEVWLVSSVQETHREFIEPLTERILELKEDYIQRLAQAEVAQDAVFDDDFDSPMHRIKSKNGVVDFDIDMDSGDDDDDDDDDDVGEGKFRRPKDTILDLNQKMMKVEIMDELLERIQELTSPLIQDD